MFGKLFDQKYIFSTSFILVWGKYLSLPLQYLKRIFSYFFFNINNKTDMNINEWIVLLIYVELLRYFFLYLRSIEKVCVSYYFKVEIRDVYIFAMFFNYRSMVKNNWIWVIDVLLQCHLRLNMLYDYKYNIHKTFLSSWRKGKFVTVKKKYVTVKTFWFIITTTNINQMHEIEYSAFNGAQSHSWC